MDATTTNEFAVGAKVESEINEKVKQLLVYHTEESKPPQTVKMKRRDQKFKIPFKFCFVNQIKQQRKSKKVEMRKKGNKNSSRSGSFQNQNEVPLNNFYGHVYFFRKRYSSSKLTHKLNN